MAQNVSWQPASSVKWHLDGTPLRSARTNEFSDALLARRVSLFQPGRSCPGLLAKKTYPCCEAPSLCPLLSCLW